MRNSRKSKIHHSVVLGSVLLSALLAVACSKTQSPDALIAEAKTYQQKGDDKAAIIQLKNALQQAPDNPEARFQLGELYNASGDGVSAEKELRRAQALGVPAARVTPGIARALLIQGQYQKLLDETEKDPQPSGETLAMRGNAYFSLNKLPEAKQAFTRALELKPDAPEALVGLAKCALLERDVATASKLSEQAIAKNPKNLEVWLFKGDLMRAQGRVNDALLAYDESLKLQPDNASARIVKANLEISSRKFAEARVDIEAAKKSAPNGVGVHYTQALLEFTEEKHQAALESIQQALRFAPEHMPSILLAGAIHFALGSMEQAEQNFKKYLERNPDNLYARKMLAGVMLKSGQTTRALEVLEPALNSGVKDAQLWLLAGETYLNARNPAKATEYFQKADALTPGISAVHTALGMSKLAQGANAEAVAELEKAVKGTGATSQASIMLITTHLRNNDLDKALAAAKAMEKGEPKNPLAHNLLGTVYQSKGDKVNARASFDKALALDAVNFSAITSLSQLDLTENKADAAKKRLEAFLQTDKKNVQAMTALANIAFATGQKDAGRTWLERAVSENPASVPAARVLVTYYLQNGDAAKARSLASKLQADHPTDAGALELLAQVQAQTGERSAAVAAYQKLAVLKPDSAAVQLQIARLQMAQNDEAAAMSALDKALQLEPTSVDAQLAMANVKGRKGDLDGALAIARALQKQQPNTAGGYVLEGDILIAKKDAPGAVKAYERAFGVTQSGLVLRKLHAALSATGKGKEADARLARWVAEHPDDTESRLVIAQTALGNGQSAAAISQLEALLKSEPNNVVAMNNLAWAYQQNKDARALPLAEKAVALAPENAAVLDTAGVILTEKGGKADLTRAVTLLQKSVTLAPQAMDTRFHLAQALAKSGDKERARKELQTVLDSNQSFAGRDEARVLMKQL